MIELYDVGRTTHKPVPGMYEFIQHNAEKYVQDPALVERLKEEAAQRELPGHSIPQELFSDMCRIWVEAYRRNEFPIDQNLLVFPDTAMRFRKVKGKGRKIGVLTSGSRDFTKILFDYPFLVDDGKGCEFCPPQETNYKLHHLGTFVDEYFLGEEIGDKDRPETFARLWERTKGGIHAIFDDKISVCRAADEGLRTASGKAGIYLVDRKAMQTSPEVLEELATRGITKIESFSDVRD